MMPGIFDTELPQLLERDDLKLTLRPQLGDLFDGDYLGLSARVRYGLSPRWELRGEVDMFAGHGLKRERVLGGAGVARVKLGAKYRFEEWLRPFWDVAGGFEYSFPTGRPPAEVTDGFRHFTPYLTFAHTFERWPAVTSFVGVGVNLTARSYTAVSPAQDRLIDDSWSITPGFVWRRGQVNYGLEAMFRSSAGIGEGSSYRVGLRPSVEWTLPPEFKLNSKNKWVLGLGLDASHGTRGSDFGVSVRVQTDFDFKRLLRARR